MARTKQVSRTGVKRIRDDDENVEYVPSSLLVTNIDIDSREAFETFREGLKHLNRAELETYLFNALPEFDPESSLSFVDRCHADVCFLLSGERGNPLDVKSLTLQLILTFAFLHLSPVDHKRIIERHRVADGVESPSSPEIGSVSLYNYDASNSDLKSEMIEPVIEEEIPEVLKGSYVREVSLPETDVAEETVENAIVPKIFTSKTQICALFDDPRLAGGGRPKIHFENVPCTHMGHRVYVYKNLVELVEPERVGTLRRGDNWNGRPDPLSPGTSDPDHPEDHRFEDPTKFNLDPYAAAQPHIASIPASLGFNRRWDSRFSPPRWDTHKSLQGWLKLEIVCAEIPFPWSDPSARACIWEWQDDHARKIEWCTDAQFTKIYKLSFWKGYYIRREKGLPCIRGASTHW